jgi:hypothetical protein
MEMFGWVAIASIFVMFSLFLFVCRRSQFLLGSLIKSACGGHTAEKKAAVQEFFAKNPCPAASRAIEQSLEKIDLVANCRRHNADSVLAWLQANASS